MSLNSCWFWVCSLNVLMCADAVRRPSFCRRQSMRVGMSKSKADGADAVSGQSDGVVAAAGSGGGGSIFFNPNPNSLARRRRLFSRRWRFCWTNSASLCF